MRTATVPLAPAGHAYRWRICDECIRSRGRCVICGGVGVADAYYCKECTMMEKDRDGCPKIVNLGSAKTDLFYERKKYGFKR